MILYSKNIIHFIHVIKHSIKEILSQEIGVKVSRDYFYDWGRKAAYPINVVIYNNKSMLGYFDPGFYELGFHECLMHVDQKKLFHVIRHELAHYMTFIQYGNTVLSHGAEFHRFCREMHWDEEVSRASLCLEEEQNASLSENNGVLRKVQKLMALTSSSHQNEAEQAMIKSQQLLLKYNINSQYANSTDDEKVFLKRIMKQKKENGKMRCIAKILETFFVSIVYHRAGDFTYLEILGNAVNVEIAEYVADVLHLELDRLWNQAQQQAGLKGMMAKNSFFLGLAKGYCKKIHDLKKQYDHDMTHALMVIERKLADAKAMAYQRLFSTKRSTGHCHESSTLGERMGRQLHINPAINRTSKSESLLISMARDLP